MFNWHFWIIYPSQSFGMFFIITMAPLPTIENNVQLTRLFEDHWIATNGPSSWNRRSLDLYVLDFFILQTIKNHTKEDYMEQVRNAFRSLRHDFISPAAHDKFLMSCIKCLELVGGNFERYLQ